MGTNSDTKFLKNSAGAIAEQFALKTSAGAGDAGAIPALNDAGVLDTTILNGTTTSAGAADAGKTLVLDGAGKIDTTALPTGIGADTAIITASEALAAGDFVNVYNSSGAKVRKADATVAGKKAMGFVKAGVANGAPATVFFEGTNDQVTGVVPGDVFLSTTPGQSTDTAPSASGNVAQNIGFATSTTAINFQAGLAITLA